MQQYKYETDIFDNKDKTIDDYILSSLLKLEADKSSYIIELHNTERTLKEEISQLKLIYNQAGREVKKDTPEQEHTKARANELYMEAALDKINKDIRRSYYLIRKNQELLDELLNKYEHVLSDSDDVNEEYRQCIVNFHSVIIKRIQSLTDKIADMNTTKVTIKNKETNSDINKLIEVKEIEFVNLKNTLNACIKEKMQLQEAKAAVRSNMVSFKSEIEEALGEISEDDISEDENDFEELEETDNDFNDIGGEQ